MVFAPFSAVYFVVYEQLKKRFPVMSMYMQLVALADYFHSKCWNSRSHSSSCNVPIGCCEDKITGMFSGDVDELITQQVQNYNNPQQNYRNIYDAVTRIIREEGFRTFSKGLSARVLSIAPATAINLSLCKYLSALQD